MPEAKYLKQNNTLSVGNCEGIGHLQKLMNENEILYKKINECFEILYKKINKPNAIRNTDMEWLKTYSVSLYHTFLLEYLNSIS